MTETRIPGMDPPPVVTMADCGCTNGAPGERVVLCEQRSSEWLTIRRGVVTASHTSEIVGLRGEPSKAKARKTYLYQLVAERITGSAAEHFVTRAMERGTELEPRARDWYAERHGPVVVPGFVWGDLTRKDIGGSPDGICAERLLEIKCMTPPVHCEFLAHAARLESADVTLAIDVAHRLQMQALMWICGVPLCDYLAYSPPHLRLPCRVITVSADASLHAAFDVEIVKFAEQVTEATEAIKEGGYVGEGSIDTGGQRENHNGADATEPVGAATPSGAGTDRLF